MHWYHWVGGVIVVLLFLLGLFVHGYARTGNWFAEQVFGAWLKGRFDKFDKHA